jgi:ABC-type multidrug transport system ATPase subunit
MMCAGKSTFLRRLTSGHEPRVAVGAQVSHIFKRTYVDNIAYDQPWDEEKFALALQIAQLTDVVQDPQEQVPPLSGGQLQRVLCARAVYKSLMQEGGTLVLDEPSSALDVATERQLFLALQKHVFPKRRILIVTHRPAVLHMMERIVHVADMKVAFDKMNEPSEYLEDKIAYNEEYEPEKREIVAPKAAMPTRALLAPASAASSSSSPQQGDVTISAVLETIGGVKLHIDPEADEAQQTNDAQKPLGTPSQPAPLTSNAAAQPSKEQQEQDESRDGMSPLPSRRHSVTRSRAASIHPVPSPSAATQALPTPSAGSLRSSPQVRSSPQQEDAQLSWGEAMPAMELEALSSEALHHVDASASSSSGSASGSGSDSPPQVEATAAPRSVMDRMRHRRQTTPSRIMPDGTVVTMGANLHPLSISVASAAGAAAPAKMTVGGKPRSASITGPAEPLSERPPRRAQHASMGQHPLTGRPLGMRTSASGSNTPNGGSFLMVGGSSPHRSPQTSPLRGPFMGRQRGSITGPQGVSVGSGSPGDPSSPSLRPRMPSSRAQGNVYDSEPPTPSAYDVPSAHLTELLPSHASTDLLRLVAVVRRCEPSVRSHLTSLVEKHQGQFRELEHVFKSTQGAMEKLARRMQQKLAKEQALEKEKKEATMGSGSSVGASESATKVDSAQGEEAAAAAAACASLDDTPAECASPVCVGGGPSETHMCAACAVHDVLRYTIILPEESYVHAVDEICAALQPVRVKNFWSQAIYQGVHAVIGWTASAAELELDQSCTGRHARTWHCRSAATRNDFTSGIQCARRVGGQGRHGVRPDH